MNPAEVVAHSRLDDAVQTFKEQLGMFPHLTLSQRDAIAQAAGRLAKDCMRIQTDMDIALIGQAFDK